MMNLIQLQNCYTMRVAIDMHFRVNNLMYRQQLNHGKIINCCFRHCCRSNDNI
jgi:hypothetical protein